MNGKSLKLSVWSHTSVSPFADSRGAVVSYLQKYVLRHEVLRHEALRHEALRYEVLRHEVLRHEVLRHEALVNRLGGLSLPRKSVVRLTDRPNMTLDVYRGCKITTQHNNTEVVSMWQNGRKKHGIVLIHFH